MTPIDLHKSYSFDTIAPTVLNSSYNNLKLVGTGDVEFASIYSDIITTNTRVRNETPGVSLPDINDMTFLLFKNISTGEKVVLSLDWIVSESITLVVSRKLTITVDNVTDQQVSIIKSALKSVGINNMDISLT